MTDTIIQVGSASDLDQAIATVDSATASGSYTIQLTADITETGDLAAIDLVAPGESLTIDGQNHALDGADTYRGLFVYSGVVKIQDLTIQNMHAKGGDAGGSGGGGGGLGGGLFVAGQNNGSAGGNVTLDDVSFAGDKATGGNGGANVVYQGSYGYGGNGPSSLGGGGGLGGNGGSGHTGAIFNTAAMTNGGGGGLGHGADGGTDNAAGGASPILAGAGGGQAKTPDGGAGGGLGGVAGADGVGGAGGFGGGGGGGVRGGGAGGFGGGGGGGLGAESNGYGGGAGGFGGGGGAESYGYKTSGAGGFGAGGGRSGGGGGGLGAGGDIFVQQGGQLSIASGVLGPGTVHGGAGGGGNGYGGEGGQGLGDAIFLQGNETQTFAPAAGKTITVEGTIADQGGNGGAGAIVVDGAGTVELDAANTFVGGLTLEQGTLVLGFAGAAGDGPVTLDHGTAVLAATGAIGAATLGFGTGSDATLAFATADAPTETIHDFLTGDTIDISDHAFAAGDTTTYDRLDDEVKVGFAGGGGVSIQLDPTLNYDGAVFQLVADGQGGTDLTVADYAVPASFISVVNAATTTEVTPGAGAYANTVTVTGSGSIALATGNAVAFTGDGALVIDPGAAITGPVVADASANDALDLAGSTAGTLTGIGTQVQNFKSITFEPGSVWTIEGSLGGLAGGTSINGFAVGDTIKLDGFTATSATYVAGTGLELGDGTNTYTVKIADLGQDLLVSTSGGVTSLSALAGSLSTVGQTVLGPITPGSGVYANTVTLTSGGSVIATGPAVSFGTASATVVVGAGASLAGDVAANGTGSDIVTLDTGAILSGNILASGSGNDAIGIGAGATVTGSLQATGSGNETIGIGAGATLAGSLQATGSGNDTITIGANATVTGDVAATGSGTDAISIASGASIGGNVNLAGTGTDTLTVAPGATVQGQILGDANDTLTLSGTTAATLGPFSGFGAITFATGSSWTIVDTLADLSAVRTITGSGTIDISDLDPATVAGLTFDNLTNRLTIEAAGGGTAGTLTFNPFSNYADATFTTTADGRGGTIVTTTPPAGPILYVANAYELDQAIATVNAASSGSYEIEFVQNIVEGTGPATSNDPAFISLQSGVQLTLDGEGHTLDGAGSHRGLVVTGGTVSIEQLTIANASVQGANGSNGAASVLGNAGGGGGAGLGGGLFVGSAAAVALDGVQFSNDSAHGGNGGQGALVGADGGGSGGFAGTDPYPDGIGNGGSGGQLQSYSLNNPGNPGNFGGGGGGGSGRLYQYQVVNSPGGAGGFGAASGSGASTVNTNGSGQKSRGGDGGGGLGAGGDVFVEQGASLTITGSTDVAGGTVTGGSGDGGGQALGGGLFIQGNTTVTLGAGQSAGQTTVISGVIADQSGNGGSGSLLITGNGTVELDGVNTYTGTTTLESGTLVIGNPNAITMSKVEVEGGTVAFTAANAPQNISFGYTDFAIDVTDMTYGPSTQLTVSNSNLVTLSSGGTSASFQLDPTQSYGGGTFLQMASDGHGGTTVTASIQQAPKTFYVGDQRELDQAIATLDGTAAGAGAYTIVFTQSITEGGEAGDAILYNGQTISAAPELFAFNLASGVSVTIDGAGHALDGANAYRGLFVYQGNVTIQDLTIQNAVAKGGNATSSNGQGGGGGGAGLGGGLFVAGPTQGSGGGNVTLENVSFVNDGAVGGNGSSGQFNYGQGTDGAGGGLGGDSGVAYGPDLNGETYGPRGGGGGGVGLGANGGSGAGLILGAASGGLGYPAGITYSGAAGPAGGADGGGGGTGLEQNATQFQENGFGGGGGVGGQLGTTRGGGGAGGFGGGGGGENAPGGFGGGGGVFGAGGFGGGGGGSVEFSTTPGGFGAGNGGDINLQYSELFQGGGGLGAGGDIFVMQGGSLTIKGGSAAAGAVAGGGGFSSGAGLGGGLFLQGNQSVTLGTGQTTDETTTITGGIADQGGNGGGGSLIIAGNGTVVLDPRDISGSVIPNSYAGGTTIQSGTLELASLNAAGTGVITFAGPATLQIDTGPAGGTLPNAIADVGSTDAIDLRGFAYAAGATATVSGSVLTVTSGGVSEYLTLSNPGPLPATSFVATSDGAGATPGVLITPSLSIIGTVAGEADTAEAPIQPFAGVTIKDDNSGATETLTITQVGQGSLSGPGLSGQNGTYTLSGDALTVTNALRALTFTPVNTLPDNYATTRFTLADTDSAGVSQSDATTTVVDHRPSVPPTLTGLETATANETLLNPFAGAVVTDANVNATDKATITVSGPGTLSGTGLSGGTNGVYTLAATTAANLGAELRGLLFTPASGVTGPGATTSFTVALGSSSGNATSTSVTDTVTNNFVFGTAETVAELDADIAYANALAPNSGTVSLTLASGAEYDLTSALQTIDLQAGVTLDLQGNGAVIDGQHAYSGLFVYSGAVSIDDLTIRNMVARGGDAAGLSSSGSGGGAGLGGGLFVANATADGAAVAGHVTLDDVSIENDTADGGNGSTPTQGANPASPGVLNSGAPGVSLGNFGEGGEFAQSGSFGGGGGGGSYLYGRGAGGFGAGDGFAAHDPYTQFGRGGGGLGAGGGIFVQDGASVSIAGSSTLSGNAVQAGNNDGQAYGAGIFVQGNQTLALEPSAGQVLTIANTIADMTGSNDHTGQTGVGTVTVSGGGTVVLSAANTFTGGTYVEGGTVVAGNASAFGTGTIHAIDPTIEYAATGTYANPIELDIASPATADPTTFKVDSGVTATISGQITTGSGNNAMGQPIDPNQPIVVSGTGTLVLTQRESYSGSTTILSGAALALSGSGSIAQSSGVADAGTFDISATSAGNSITSLTGASTGTVALGSHNLTITAASGTFAGILQDGGSNGGGVGGSVTLTSGSQTFSGADTYSGGTTVTGGTLTAAHVNASFIVDALGTGTVTLDGGTLTLNLPANTQNPGNPDFLTNAVTVTSNGGMLDGGAALGGTASAIDVTQGITGTGPLTFTDGAFVLDGDNSGFSGATTIAGTSAHPTFVLASGTHSLSSASAYTLVGNATLGILASGITSQTIGSLAGAGTLTAIGQTGDMASLTTGADNTNTTYSGLIEDGQQSFNSSATVALVKTGTGTFTLSGANTYSGGTTISGGTLDLAAADTVSAGGAVTSGAAGTGTITFAGTAATPATLALESAAQPASGGAFASTLSGFGTNDALDLKGFTFASGATAVDTNGTLAVTSNGTTESFTLASPTATTFYAHLDSAGTGTLVDTVAPPTITGTHGTGVTDNASSTPFSGVTVGDTNSAGQQGGSNGAGSATETLTVTPSNTADGTLSDPNASTDGSTIANGVVTLTGMAAQVTADLRQLVFSPAAGAANSVTPTTFTLSDTSSAEPTAPVTDANTVVTDTDSAVAPTITGGTANQQTTGEQALTPFTNVMVADGNAGNPTETLTIAVSGDGGTLRDGQTTLTETNGTYTVTGTLAQVNAELANLTFASAVAQPNAPETTTFTLSDSSSVGGNAAASDTIDVTDTANPVAPTVTGGTANQQTTGEQAMTPFTNVMVADGNAGGPTETVTIAVSGEGGTVRDGQTTLTETNGAYTVAGTVAQVNAELANLTFASAAGQPNAPETTTFTLSDSSTVGGNAAASDTIDVTDTANPVTPTITGGTANQAITDAQIATPFSGVTITDPDFGASESTTITVTAGGVASDADGMFAPTTGLTRTGVGTYVLKAGSPLVVQAALRALVFVPTAHQVAPSTSVTTGFALSVSDGIAPTVTDGTTSLVATATETAPAIGGTTANQPITDAQTATPFSGVTITDPDFGASESTTITVTAGGVASDADGTFTPTTGLTKTGVGTYILTSGTPGEVQAALRALVFTPTAHQVTPGSSITTGFALSVSDGIAPAATTDSTTSVVATAADDPPVIGGTATTAITDQQTANPFSGVSVSDADTGITGITATVSSDPADGSFTAASLAAAGFTGQNGSYSLTTGTDAATLATDLQKLVFAPTAHQVAPGASVTTTFKLALNDQHGGTGSDSTTSVVATAVAVVPSSGIAVDGYIVGATVFADANHNGILDPGDASTTTDSHGAYTLAAGSAPLVLVGGTDSATGLPTTIPLQAPAGASIISPITTLISKVAALDGGDVGAAQAKVAAALGLTGNPDLLTLDPVEGTLDGNAAATAAFVAGSLVENTVALLTAGGSTSAFDALAATLNGQSGLIDLTNGMTLSGLAKAAGLGGSAASAVVAIAQASNVLLVSNAAAARSPTGVFSSVTASSIAAQGDASSALAAAVSSSDPDALGNVVSAFIGAALTGVVATDAGRVTLPSGPAAPSIAFDPMVSVSDPNTATLTGTVSDASGVKSVEIFEGTTDLGSATVDPTTGTWSFAHTFTPGFHTGLTGLATANDGATAAVPSSYDLTTGVRGAPYAAYQDRYDPTTGNYEGQTFFTRHGALEMQTQYSPTPDGGFTVLSSGGTAFAKTPYFALVDTYDAAGQPVEEDVYYKGGQQAVSGLVPGRALDSISNDTFYAKGGGNSFVFTPHFGQDTITSFRLGGQNHDTISLPDSAASRLGAILDHATSDAQGDTTLHLNAQNSITIQGVSIAELKQHRGDFTFHT